MSGILIIGAGGHGKVVADILRCTGHSVKGFLDDDWNVWETIVMGLPVLGAVATFGDHSPTGLVLGIGSNRVRKVIVDKLGQTAEDLWVSALHPRSVIAETVQIGVGTVVAANAVINPDTVIGKYVIINTGATVDHDCQIDDYVHIGPGAHLGGGVHVGEQSLVGIGASILPYHTIGAEVTVGAGAVVVKDIPDEVVAKGIPARW